MGGDFPSYIRNRPLEQTADSHFSSHTVICVY
jgi:hypothetical protein